MYKIKVAIEEWKATRQATISSLRHYAKVLHDSHRENAKTEHASAKTSLIGDLVGLGGVLFAPFSGGLSLAAVGVSTAAGLKSYVDKRDANNKDERIVREARRERKQAVEKDNRATEELNKISENCTYLENELKVMKIGELIISLEEKTYIDIKFNVQDIRSSFLPNQLEQRDASLFSSGLHFSKQAANLKAALTSAEQVVHCTKITTEAARRTKTIKEVVSSAKTINEISQTAKSLSTAKQAAVMSLQASQSVAKSTATFAAIAKGSDGVVKTIGTASSATNSARVALDVVTVSGQAASAAKTVTKAVRAGTAISTATKGANITIKTVRNVKEASSTVKTVTQVATDSNKAIRTTRVTTNAARVTKVSEKATKAASISKVGLVINAVVIPIDLYNLSVASENLHRSYDDVKDNENLADDLEAELENIIIKMEGTCECLHELHLQLCKVYEDHRIEKIYEYLQLMYQKLEFRVPIHY
ncbi:uncharacterized protein LOC123557672 [Mercenaria mercenaria]|uniref:uncharacterized protein LOC123557672 n=1 Tax=Mercenaria mercenaria TaxID=6596 RepID=UPI00234F29AB|nr:uncharacterized protein LOC123557672 [Mercenaria mercenaria]